MDQNFRRYLVDHRKGQLKKETPLSMSKAPLKEKPNIIGKVLGGIAGSKNKSFWTLIQKLGTPGTECCSCPTTGGSSALSARSRSTYYN